jgi:cytochrome b561
MNDAQRYNAVAKTLHWLMAFAIISLIIIGKIMVDLPRDDPDKFALYQSHKSVGLTILFLTLVRIAWRLLYRAPPLPASMKTWEKLAASGTHLAFYFMMLAIPLSGWAIASTSSSGVPTLWFGLFEVPALPGLEGIEDMHEVHESAEEAHELLANLTILLLILHVAAGLKHHFWDRDDVLRRMLPFAR